MKGQIRVLQVVLLEDEGLSGHEGLKKAIGGQCGSLTTSQPRRRHNSVTALQWTYWGARSAEHSQGAARTDAMLGSPCTWVLCAFCVAPPRRISCGDVVTGVSRPAAGSAERPAITPTTTLRSTLSISPSTSPSPPHGRISHCWLTWAAAAAQTLLIRTADPGLIIAELFRTIRAISLSSLSGAIHSCILNLYSSVYSVYYITSSRNTWAYGLFLSYLFASFFVSGCVYLKALLIGREFYCPSLRVVTISGIKIRLWRVREPFIPLFFV